MIGIETYLAARRTEEEHGDLVSQHPVGLVGAAASLTLEGSEPRQAEGSGEPKGIDQHVQRCRSEEQGSEHRPEDGEVPPDGFADCDIGAVELPEPGFLLQLGAGLAFLLTLGRACARN